MIYTIDKFKYILRKNQEVVDYVAEKLGPTTAKQAAERFDISQTALMYALQKGESLSELSRGKRENAKTGREILELIPGFMPQRTNEEYAARLIEIAHQLLKR